MSLDMINRELEELLNQIRRMKNENQINETLTRVEELRQQAYSTDSTINKMNKSQDVRTFENFTAVYKGLKDRTDILRNAGRLEVEIDDENSVEHRITYQYKEVFEKSIKPKKLKMLEEFKDKYTEAELSRVLQEEIDWRESRVEQQEREIEERDVILVAADKREIDEYDISKNIFEMTDAIRDAQTKIDEANAIIETADAEIARIDSDATKTDDEKSSLKKVQEGIKRVQRGIIRTQKTIIKNASISLADNYNIIEADNLLDRRGNINEEILNSISKNAFDDLQRSGNIIKSNLERFVNRNSGSIQSLKDIEKFIGKIPDDFDSLSMDETENILEKLRTLKKDTDSKSTYIHTLKTKIGEIEDFLVKQAKEQDALAGKGKTNADGTSRYGFRSPKQYRDSGIELDPVYKNKTFWERNRDKREFILQSLPPDAPFKKVRAFFRSFSPRAGYALSEAKLARETQYRRKEEVFQSASDAFKKGIARTTEEARVIGMKNVRTDKLSGKRKAQMQEREIDD